MNDAGNLNTYSVRYRTFTPAGALDIVVQKKIIEADSQLSAAEILKSKQKEAGISEIRIDSIERMNAEKTIKKKRKPMALIFFICLGVATLARLASRLIE